MEREKEKERKIKRKRERERGMCYSYKGSLNGERDVLVVEAGLSG